MTTSEIIILTVGSYLITLTFLSLILWIVAERKINKDRDQRREIEAMRKANDSAEEALDKPIAPSGNEGVIISNLLRENEALRKDKHRVDGFVNWLDAEIKKMMYVSSALNVDQRVQALREARKQLEKLRNGLGEQ